MSGRRSRPSQGAINPHNLHNRGESLETEPLPKELEHEIERADPDNALIQDSLFEISANHQAVRSTELTSDDNMSDHEYNKYDKYNRKYKDDNDENEENDDNDGGSTDSESVTSHEKRRSARDSRIMEDVIALTNITSQKNNKGNRNEDGIANIQENENENENDSDTQNVFDELIENGNGNGNGNDNGNSNNDRRDSIDMKIAESGENFLMSHQKEKKWTHARKASTNIVRNQSNRSVKSDDSGFSSNPFEIADDNDGNNNSNNNENNDENTGNSASQDSLDMADITFRDSDSDENDDFGNNNNNNNDDNDDTMANKQTNAFASAFAQHKDASKQRPSINTALKTYGTPKELENEIQTKLAGERGFKHARKASTQIAKQRSGHSDVIYGTSDVSSINENENRNEVDAMMDNPDFLQENESSIVGGIMSQQQLAKHHTSKISRTFSNEDVNKIKDRSDNGNDGPSTETIRQNNKARGSQIFREIDIEQLAEISGQHKREQSLTTAFMGALNNDSNVSAIANSLAGFLAPNTMTGATESQTNSNGNGNNNDNKELLSKIESLERENESLKKEKQSQETEMENLRKKIESLQLLENQNNNLSKECEKLERENKVLSSEMVKINDEYNNQIEYLQRHIKNLESAKLESIQQMANEFNNMRAAIKSFHKR